MGRKHLKYLRAEKSKVKFKKKNLPKGHNITNVNFKVKKILTAEQFKKVEENEPLSSWNLSLKDLLTRLNHYNYTSRLNSLINLKELILKHPMILEGPSLHCIITGILSLLTDVEHKIRVTAIKILEDIFKKIQYKSLIPFFDILKLYLDCAMTHREFSVQQDSLKLIDVIIKFVPEAIKKNSNTVIYNFTRILVNQKCGNHSVAVFSKKSKQDLDNFKSDMFNKFYQLLKVIYGSTTKIDSSVRNLEISSLNRRYNLKRLNNCYQKSPDLSNLFKQSCEFAYISKQSESSEIQNQISIIMPLLFDTWLESGTDQENECILGCNLNKHKGLLLKSLLKIMLLLYEKIIFCNDKYLKNWYVSNYVNSFLKTFMTKFPYQEQLIGESSASCVESCVKQNLILCYLFYCFKIKNYIYAQEAEVDNYILKYLNLNNLSGIKILPKIIQILLNCGKKQLFNDLLIGVIKIYDSLENVEFQEKLFNILLKEVLTNKESDANLSQPILSWKVSLPKRLLQKKLTLNIIKGILQVLIQDKKNEVLEEIQKKAHDIIKAVSYINIKEKNALEMKKMMAHILYRCKNEILQELIEKKLYKEDINPQKIRKYFFDIFSYKLQNKYMLN